MGKSTARILVLFALSALLPGVAVRAELIETTTRDGIFHIVGRSFDATQTVAAIAAEMGGLGMDYFPHSARLDPVVVELRPVDDAEAGRLPPFAIAPDAGTQVRVVIYWNERRTFSEVCQALASGFLRRVANVEFGPTAHAHTPAWLELAFAQMLQVRIRPTYIDAQARLARTGERLPVDAIFAAEGPFDPLEMNVLAQNSGWLMRLIESQAQSRRVLRQGLRFVLGGGSPVRALEGMISEDLGNPAERELWWAVGFAQIVRGQTTPVYDLENSRTLIRTMAVVTAAVNGGDRRLTGWAIWEHREMETVALAVNLRLQELKLEIQKINPVYYNAMLSLGLYLEWVLAGVEEAAEKALADFESDLRAAYRLELAITRLLHW